MTFLEKAILAEIKENNERDDYLVKFNKGIKLEKVGKYNGEIMANRQYGDTCHYEYPNASNGDWTSVKVEDTYLRLSVECSYKPSNKYDNNIVMYEVYLYSCGMMVAMFDGTKYVK